ncbi:hypothetical protein [uncultured Butyricimonas sp.]|uniref:hypothetical protein n=1 Tax=uncultured Butyricimonas sp. TaxID=1268785 RepID=UPI0026DBA3EC|nr:hypothetical protein [uncultured Butyricimonas sp.]
MQLNTISAGIIPLTITGTMMISSINVFSQDVHSSIICETPDPANDYLNSADENIYTNMVLKLNFEKYLKAWRYNTMFFSFSDQITKEDNFQKIVSMGKHAVPFILEEIKQNPSSLVWALNIIYNKTISQNNITIKEACRLWVKTLNNI